MVAIARRSNPATEGGNLIVGIHHAAGSTLDLERLLRFYRDELGFEDCMADTEYHRAVVAEASGKPVLRAMQLTGMVVEHAYRWSSPRGGGSL